MLAAINAELKNADTATMGLILETLRHAKQPRPAAMFEVRDGREALEAQTTSALHFIGDNLTLEEYERLSLKERAQLQLRLKDQNQTWLREQFAKRKAAWLVVVNGKVESWGKSLKDRPIARQNLEIAQRTGRFPFVFINDDYITIEESASAWS
ncbi:hypothetical protein HUU05_03850 [candidate division KSB1 bacterium]|nr:hypothetical protein [candidate division KSB1 bacterium]